MDSPLQQQVRAIAKRPGNSICAECPERHPCYASILKSVSVGVFVCEKCYRHHFRLGVNLCEVKPIDDTTWSRKEVAILSKTGNEFVNSFFEANLEGDASWENDKEIITFDPEEEARLRSAFVKNKYIKKKYFCQEKYLEARNSIFEASGSTTTTTKVSSAAKSKYQTKPSKAAAAAAPAKLEGHPETQGEAQESTTANKETPSLRSLMGLHKTQTSVSTRNLSSSQQRRSSLPANTGNPKKPGTGLGSYLEKTDDETQKRRCKSVAGTSETTPSPMLHSDKVYAGKVDVSPDELRALKAKKKAARRESKRMSQSEQVSGSGSTGRARMLTRRNSPRGVHEELSQSLQETTTPEDFANFDDAFEQDNSLDDSDHAVVPNTTTIPSSTRKGAAPPKPERRRRRDTLAKKKEPERRRRRDSTARPRRTSTASPSNNQEEGWATFEQNSFNQ